MPKQKTYDDVAREAARLLKRKNPFGISYVSLIVNGKRGKLDGIGARTIRSLAVKWGLKGRA